MLRAGGTLCRVLQPDTSVVGIVWLENVGTGERRTCTEVFLREAIEQEQVIVFDEEQATLVPHQAERTPGDRDRIVDQIPMAIRSQASVKVLVDKHRWLSRIRKHGLKSLRPGPDMDFALKELQQIHGEQCPYLPSTLYKASLRLRASAGDSRSLFPSFYKRGARGIGRLDQRVEGLITAALDKASGKTSGRLAPSKIYTVVHAAVIAINKDPSCVEPLKVPSAPTISRRFKERFSAYEVSVRNFGKARADREFRENGARVRAEAGLDVVHYDDTDTCVFAIDDLTGLPWGRCWLTIGIDEKTDMPIGRSMSERSRCSWSAISAVIDGIFQKNPSEDQYSSCAGNWDSYGHHGTAVFDNASYNGSIATEASLLDFDIEMEFARPHQPTDKSPIEHFNHMLKSDFIVEYPGFSGAKEDREALDHGIGTAVSTTSQFRLALNRWIVDGYMNKPGGRDGLAPRTRWQEEFTQHQPYLPARRPSIELMRTVLQPLTFRDSGGLLRLGLRYQSEDLKDIRRRLGANAEVMIRYPKHRMDKLFVLNPMTGNYLDVPCIEDARYVRNLNDYQQRLVLKRCRHMKLTAPGIEEMARAREALRLDTIALAKSKKMSERKRSFQARQAGLSFEPDGYAAAQSKKPVQTVVVSELERIIADMDAIQLDETPAMRAALSGDGDSAV